MNIVGGLNDYLKESKGLPENVQKLQAEAGIKVVIANLDGQGRNCCTTYAGEAPTV